MLSVGMFGAGLGCLVWVWSACDFRSGAALASILKRYDFGAMVEKC